MCNTRQHGWIYIGIVLDGHWIYLWCMPNSFGGEAIICDTALLAMLGWCVMGLLLAVVMLHVWIAEGTCTMYATWCMQNTYLSKNDIIFVSQVIISGIILGPHVHLVVIGMPSLADSLMMMQLCRHYWVVKTLQQCTYWLATSTIWYLAGQHTVQLRLHRIAFAADDNTIYENEGSAYTCDKQWEVLAPLPSLQKVKI